MIQISNLTKAFSSQILFDNIDLQINREEKIGLIGRNGNGKTTLFRIITREEEADSGEIIIPKKDLFSEDLQSKLSSDYARNMKELLRV